MGKLKNELNGAKIYNNNDRMGDSFFSLYRIQLNYTVRTVAVIVVGVGEKATENVCV